MSKEAIAAFDVSKKKHNSRPVEDKDIEVVVPEFDPNVEDVRPLDISDDSRATVETALEKSNTAYKYYNAQNDKVRQAQDALRQQHSNRGDNNPEYVRLANELNTATREMLLSQQDYEVARGLYTNAKRRFGKNTTF